MAITHALDEKNETLCLSKYGKPSSHIRWNWVTCGACRARRQMAGLVCGSCGPIGEYVPEDDAAAVREAMRQHMASAHPKATARLAVEAFNNPDRARKMAEEFDREANVRAAQKDHLHEFDGPGVQCKVAGCPEMGSATPDPISHSVWRTGVNRRLATIEADADRERLTIGRFLDGVRVQLDALESKVGEIGERSAERDRVSATHLQALAELRQRSDERDAAVAEARGLNEKLVAARQGRSEDTDPFRVLLAGHRRSDEMLVETLERIIQSATDSELALRDAVSQLGDARATDPMGITKVVVKNPNGDILAVYTGRTQKWTRDQFLARDFAFTLEFVPDPR